MTGGAIPKIRNNIKKTKILRQEHAKIQKMEIERKHLKAEYEEVLEIKKDLSNRI